YQRSTVRFKKQGCLQYTETEKEGYNSLCPFVEPNVPEHGDGQETQNPVTNGRYNRVNYSGSRNNPRVYAESFGTNDLHPKVRGRTALDDEDEEVDDTQDPDDGDINVDDVPVHLVGGYGEEKDGNGRPD